MKQVTPIWLDPLSKSLDFLPPAWYEIAAKKGCGWVCHSLHASEERHVMGYPIVKDLPKTFNL